MAINNWWAADKQALYKIDAVEGLTE